MAEYERSRLVQASPDEVFAFVSDASNLATFLPTVDSVEPQAEGRVEVHGEAVAHAFQHRHRQAQAPQQTPRPQPRPDHHPPAPHVAQAGAQSLEAALDSLRNLMERRGGKEEPASIG